jgi:CheY-like chemotaxis protein
MALTIPLYRRSGCTLFLDDDHDYLEMLGMVVPTHIQMELYSRPSAFAERMHDEPARWEADAAHHLHIIERWRLGQPLMPQVLRYWASHTARNQLAQTCVVDFAMPGTDGLKVLTTLLDWPGTRILLTGQADDQIAVQAFNGGLIDQFIPKQLPDIAGRLVSALIKVAYTAHPRLNTLWRAVLQPTQLSLLQVPSVVRDLQAYSQKRWVEHVFLGEPFGVLGLTAQGQCEWLQLEPTAGLADLRDLASSAGVGLELMRDIDKGLRLPAVELHQHLNLRGPIRTAPAFAIGDDGLLLGAVFALEGSDLPQPIYPYHNFLEVQGSRAIQDA